jgi:hypothetical protein
MRAFFLIIAFLNLVVTMTIMMPGCKDNSTEPDKNASISQDAAETIAAAIGEDNGGTMDQIGDVCELATLTSHFSLFVSGPFALSTNNGYVSFDTSYNPVTQKWTGTLVRVRASLTRLYFASIRRTYEWQFLKGSTPQRNYIVGTDTATTISFKIDSGTVYAYTPRWKHEVTSLTGDWTITNTNSPVITINGTASRSAIDTIITFNARRVLNNHLDLTYTNITASRGDRSTVASTASGNISGTYDATVIFLTAQIYAERNISRTFSIDFSGGTAVIHIGDKIYNCNLALGVLQ